MKKVFKLFFIAVCFLISCNLFSPENSKASTNVSITTNDAKADFFIYVRVVENGRVYIYIYTDGGIYVTKIEEL